MMKPFDESAPCPKCGSADLSTRFFAESRHERHCERNGSTWSPMPYGEHLQRQCRRCQYGWDDAILKRKKKPKIDAALSEPRIESAADPAPGEGGE